MATLLIPVADILAHAEERKSQFAGARRERYKTDLRLFGGASDRGCRDDPGKALGSTLLPAGTDAERGFAEVRGGTAGQVERRGGSRSDDAPSPLTRHLGLRGLLLSQLTC